jgi:hypothetical protein
MNPNVQSRLYPVVVAKNLDCSHFDNKNEIIEYFRKTITKYLGHWWYLRSTPYKNQFYEKTTFCFKCSKIDKTKCKVRCSVILNTHTNTADIYSNLEQHNH